MNSSSRRPGAVLIMALVGLVLMTVIGGVLLRWALMEHKLLASREEQSQAVWLAETGIERAAAQLAQNADYAGEKCLIAAADLPADKAAVVQLRVSKIDGQPRRRSVDVDVEYPSDSKTPTRIRKTIIYQLREDS